MKYLVVIEKAENNYSAYAPDVLGCIATGRTIEETVNNMKEALDFHLESFPAEGESLPTAISSHAYVEINLGT